MATVLAATAVVGVVAAAAGAAGVDGHSEACSGDVTWRVSPLSGTASATFDPGGSCAGASASADSSGASHLGTAPWTYSGWTQSYSFVPAINTTAPAGAFDGVVTGTSGSWAAVGHIAGVNGGGFEANVLWNDGTRLSFDTYAGAVSCGPYCFRTKAVWSSGNGVAVN